MTQFFPHFVRMTSFFYKRARNPYYSTGGLAIGLGRVKRVMNVKIRLGLGVSDYGISDLIFSPTIRTKRDSTSRASTETWTPAKSVLRCLKGSWQSIPFPNLSNGAALQPFRYFGSFGSRGTGFFWKFTDCQWCIIGFRWFSMIAECGCDRWKFWFLALEISLSIDVDSAAGQNVTDSFSRFESPDILWDQTGLHNGFFTDFLKISPKKSPFHDKSHFCTELTDALTTI